MKPKFGSFGADGFVYALVHERHIKFYFLYLLLFSGFAIWADISTWLYIEGFMYFLFLVIFELINTALEIMCDFISTDRSIEIKRIKDLGAAIVFAHGFFAGTLLAVNTLLHVLG